MKHLDIDKLTHLHHCLILMLFLARVNYNLIQNLNQFLIILDELNQKSYLNLH